MNEKISVLLASYKHKRWLGEAIDSVLNQIFKDFELIIVDDGGNDGSSEIIKNYAKKDSRIKYEMFSENRGAIVAIKRCYDLSCGKYIAIMNSDDVWELDKLEKQVSILDKNKKLGAVFGLPKFIDEKGKDLLIQSEFDESLELKNKEEFINFFFKEGNCVCHPTILIRRECYEKVGFYNPTLRSLPDFEMWVRLFFKYDVKILDDVLIKFRKHSFNESGLNINNVIRGYTEYKQILNIFLNQIKNIEDLEKIFPEFKLKFKVKNNLLIPFYIAQIALEINTPYHNDFAFDVLYKEMRKPEVLKLLEKHKLYSLVQLSNDVVNKDVYRISLVKKEKTILKIPLICEIKKIKQYSCKKLLFKFMGFKLGSINYK